MRKTRFLPSPVARRLLETALLAAVYFAVAHLCLRLESSHAIAPVWPPTGIALAALLLRGRRLWPGIALGAFAGTVSIGTPIDAAIGPALAAALEPVCGAWLLERWGLQTRLKRPRDLAVLFFLGGVLPVTLSATFAMLWFQASGFISSSALPGAWAAWWAANLMGVVVFTPALLIWGSQPLPSRHHSLWEALALGLCLVASALVSWSGLLGIPAGGQLTFLYTPFLIWSAFRFGLHGAATAALIGAVIAVAGTLMGEGPLSRGSMTERLVVLDVYLTVQAAVGLVIAASDEGRREAIRIREDFLSIASHELRTPLTPLKLTFQSLERAARNPDAGALTAERLQRGLDSASRQIERLVTLVDNLLDGSRLNAGRLVLASETLDLGTLVQDTVTRFAPMLRAAACPLSMRVEPGLVGHWDRLRLEQVVANLLTNALKFGPGQPIEISVSRDDSQAVLEVRDHGQGVAISDQARIFEPYEQAGDPAARTGGLGLGLYISREIILAHGGTVDLDCPSGAGASFRVRLPLNAVANPPSPVQPQAAPGTRGGPAPTRQVS